MFTLKHLQREVAVWSHYNFPKGQPHQPLLGAAEEIGELCHAHLKDEQGIRGTHEEHLAAKIDAVADVIIYLADYCARNSIDLQKSAEETWIKVKRRDWRKDELNGRESSK
jgi:NTP pyrophosphatase (non-canonical NTP hydrolase)